jgi:hypothetical protein
MFNFTEDFTLKGKWWIPGERRDEDKGIYGELHYSKSEGLTLNVEGSRFGSKYVRYSKHNEIIPLIHGVIKYLHYVSLFNLTAFESGKETHIRTECSAEFAL